MTATKTQNWFIRNLKTQKVFLLFAHSIRGFLNYLNLFYFFALRIFFVCFHKWPVSFLFLILFFLFSLSFGCSLNFSNRDFLPFKTTENDDNLFRIRIGIESDRISCKPVKWWPTDCDCLWPTFTLNWYLFLVSIQLWRLFVSPNNSNNDNINYKVVNVNDIKRPNNRPTNSVHMVPIYIG